MVVPQVPQTDTRRSSRRGGSSRTASRSSSPAGSMGIPDEDETDESEANEYTSISAAGIGLCKFVFGILSHSPHDIIPKLKLSFMSINFRS